MKKKVLKLNTFDDSYLIYPLIDKLVSGYGKLFEQIRKEYEGRIFEKWHTGFDYHYKDYEYFELVYQFVNGLENDARLAANSKPRGTVKDGIENTKIVWAENQSEADRIFKRSKKQKLIILIKEEIRKDIENVFRDINYCLNLADHNLLKKKSAIFDEREPTYKIGYMYYKENNYADYAGSLRKAQRFTGYKDKEKGPFEKSDSSDPFYTGFLNYVEKANKIRSKTMLYEEKKLINKIKEGN